MMSTEYEFFIFKEDSHSVRAKEYKNMIPLSPGMFGYSVSRTGTHAELANSLMDSLRDFRNPARRISQLKQGRAYTRPRFATTPRSRRPINPRFSRMP